MGRAAVTPVVALVVALATAACSGGVAPSSAPAAPAATSPGPVEATGPAGTLAGPTVGGVTAPADRGGGAEPGAVGTGPAGARPPAGAGPAGAPVPAPAPAGAGSPAPRGDTPGSTGPAAAPGSVSAFCPAERTLEARLRQVDANAGPGPLRASVAAARAAFGPALASAPAAASADLRTVVDSAENLFGALESAGYDVGRVPLEAVTALDPEAVEGAWRRLSSFVAANC